MIRLILVISVGCLAACSGIVEGPSPPFTPQPDFWNQAPHDGGVPVPSDATHDNSGPSTMPDAAPTLPPPPTGPLTLINASATTPTRIELYFSHPLDAATSERPERYTISGLPVFAAVLKNQGLTLELSTHYQIAENYTVSFESTPSDIWGRSLTNPAPIQLKAQRIMTHVDESFSASLDTLKQNGWYDTKSSKSGSGKWTVQSGKLHQSSNAYGGDGDDFLHAEKHGIFFVAGQTYGSNVVVQADFTSTDNDGVGLVARFIDANNHYRLQWFHEGDHRELVKVSNGQTTRLAMDTTAYEIGRTYRIRLSVEGGHIAFFVDDRLVLAAEDPTPLPAGASGIFVWANSNVDFDNFISAEIPANSNHARPAAMQTAPHSAAPMNGAVPMVGDILTDALMVQARSSGPGFLAWEYDTFADYRSAKRSQFIVLSQNQDYAYMQRLSGLSPDTSYYLRPIFADANDLSAINRGPTIRATTASLSTTKPLVFAIAADIALTHRDKLALLDELRSHAPQFTLSLGDFPYMDAFLAGNPAAKTLEGMRMRHREIRGLRPVRELFEAMPIMAIWDDHEVANDWDANTSPSLVSLGVQVWNEHIAHAPAEPGTGGIYRKIQPNPLVDIFMLDTRRFRSANSSSDNSKKTMLGATQKAWLKNELLASQAPIKFLVSGVPFRYGKGGDHWSGFTTERNEIFQYILNNQISGVTMLSADQHWSSVHYHPEGFVEVMACPISANLFTPPAKPKSQVPWSMKTYSYGLAKITPASNGGMPSLVVEIYGEGKTLLHSEKIF
jgi:phosphodiesterase/alkaline phosphatase D-like protein